MTMGIDKTRTQHAIEMLNIISSIHFINQFDQNAILIKNKHGFVGQKAAIAEYPV
jgi:hypothetical protein